jgi:hypothetical protein
MPINLLHGNIVMDGNWVEKCVISKQKYVNGCHCERSEEIC